MDDNRKNYASIALYLAVLAMLFSIAIYIVQPGVTLQLQISLTIMVLSLIGFGVLDPERVKEIFGGRQARHGINSVVLALAVIGITIIVNVVVFQNTDDWGLRWDLTEDQENTLAPETIEILEALPDRVTASAFYSLSGSETVFRTEAILDDFKFFGKGNFVYSFIDPDDPEFLLLAEQLNVTRDGTLVLRLGERTENVLIASEQNLASALVKLLNPNTPTVYFLSGHGEHPLEGAKEISYGEVQTLLERKNYQVNTLNLLATNEIPADASVIVVAGPTQPLSEQEVILIQEFSDAGGALMVFYNPSLETEFADQNDPLQTYLAVDWGVVLENDIIFDPFNGSDALTENYADHIIAEEIDRVFTLYHGARSVRFDENFADVRHTNLVQTIDAGWAETNMESVLDQTFDLDDADNLAPNALAVLGENTIKGSRLVVVGDSNFATIAYIQNGANGGLITAMTEWAAGQEDLLTLTPRPQTQRIVLLPSQGSLGLVLLLSVFVIPGTILGAGIFVWVRRRQKK